MKIIQSFWSKPVFDNNRQMSGRKVGGWIKKKYNYMSWALSCLQFRKYYDEVELITDQLGYYILIDLLKLPYTSVRIELDNLNNYDTGLWALGKIYSYSIQEQPFLHCDGDVYIWEKLPPHVDTASLVCQNIENANFYKPILDSIREHFSFIPEIFPADQNGGSEIKAANAGVMGGTDLDFFKKFTQLAFEFVNRNAPHLDKTDVGMLNVIFEQLFFYALAKNRSAEVSCILKDVNEAFDGLAEFTAAPGVIKYIHTIGYYKRFEYIGEMLSFRLQCDYPDYYYRIDSLIRNRQL